MEKKTVEVEGLQLAYYEQGHGRSVVFVHGNSGSWRVFEKQMQSNLSEKYRLLVLDLPGHGESAWADHVEGAYSASFFTRALAGFCRELDCEDAVLVGSSLGGHLALESIPLLTKVRGAVIFGTPPLENPPWMEKAFLPSPSIGFIFKEELDDDEIALWGRTMYAPEIPVPDFSAKDIRRTDPRVRPALGACVVSSGLLDEVEIVRSLRFPLAILHGEHEQIASLEYIRGLALPNLWQGDVQVIQAASHMVQWEQPEEFNNLLGQYLADIEKG